MPDNMWMLLGLGAVAVWALNRGNGEDPASEGQEMGLGPLVGSAMASTGVTGGTGSGAIDPTSPTSIILISPNGDMREGPIQGVPASVAGDEDIGVLPVESDRYVRANQAMIEGDLGETAIPIIQGNILSTPIVQPALAQDAQPVITSPPKTSSAPYQFNISPDYLLSPVEGQTFTTPVGVDTTIQIIESPVASHSFHTKPSVLRDYLAQFE